MAKLTPSGEASCSLHICLMAADAWTGGWVSRAFAGPPLNNFRGAKRGGGKAGLSTVAAFYWGGGEAPDDG